MWHVSEDHSAAAVGGDPDARCADTAWSVCLAIAAMRRSGRCPDRSACFAWQGERLVETAGDDSRASIRWRRDGGWQPLGSWRPDAIELFDLYRPLLDAAAGQPYVVAHLGQSVDGRIATRSGDSRYVTGPENLLHLHRMRALSDAIVVGARTVEADDPQLTTRLVRGRSPTRVIIDPSARLGADRRVFRDGRAIIKGTQDLGVARGLYSRYIGL